MSISTLASPLSPVRITARCHYCTHAFTVEVDPFGQLGAEDRDGKLCCETCFCSDCGGGHYTDAEANQCAYLHDYANPADDPADGEFTDWLEQASYGDPDAAYDMRREAMMDMELYS
ncbi:hypothetical protein [Actinophytocola sp.]|uniref:hypothetical protein n=1 Tax=Actinophytocola sp. TaxID=1872138 RepID=UPI002D7FBFCF|nr:hypothetical protein [Actinophytocola sp.]HET9144129.1 hypothetical protein [Actinophytocola sp.]